MTERALLQCALFPSLFIHPHIMNSNDKILDVLLKISKSLDEIKERMGSAPCPAADKKKVEQAASTVSSGALLERIVTRSCQGGDSRCAKAEGKRRLLRCLHGEVREADVGEGRSSW